MSEPATEPTAAAQPQAGQAQPPKLEDMLAGLDESVRDTVLKEVRSARTEARNLRDRVKAAEPQLQELASLKAAAQTAEERQAAALADANARLQKAERDALRSSVALRKGLPANLASRLQGDDEAALEADADELLTMVAKQDTTPRVPRPDPSQGSSANGGAAPDLGSQFGAFLQQQMGRQTA